MEILKNNCIFANETNDLGAHFKKEHILNPV